MSKDTRTALEYMIENKKAYDESLDITNGLGVRAEAELAAKDAVIEAARKYVESDDNMNTYRYGELVKALAALAGVTS